MKVLFVHGINVRADAADKVRASIENELRKRLPDTVKVSACVWGNDLGAFLSLGGRSIPMYETARGAPGAPDAEVERQLWSELYEDPLAELDALSHEQTVSDTPRSPRAVRTAAQLLSDVKALGSRADVQQLLAQHDWQPYLRAAVNVVADSSALQGLAAQSRAIQDVVKPVSRAVYAALYREAEAVGEPPLGSASRGDILAQLEVSLGGSQRGLVSWFANRYARRRRGALMDSITPIVGDIIIYQGRGEAIRKRIAAAIYAHDEPVCVMAHSLGGVATVDTLLLHPDLRLKVSHLFTMGSQPGYFHEVNALVGLPSGQQMAPDFPKWVNFYDKADMLSFLAEPAFPGRVRDVEVDSGEPFPRSHSAYWHLPAVWAEVTAGLTR